MANIHGVAGEWSRVRGTVFGLWPLFLCVFALGFACATLFFLSVLAGSILFVLALGAAIYFFQHGLGRVESFFKGARGEERVCGILKGLPADYHVFNDFIAGGKHVDHVVVGPAGVFSVETKFWSGGVTVEEGHILVNGRLPSHPPIDQTLREAALVKEKLVGFGWAGPVTPVLAFASDNFEAKIAELRGVVVLNASHLGESFLTNRVILPPDELGRLVSIMENCR